MTTIKTCRTNFLRKIFRKAICITGFTATLIGHNPQAYATSSTKYLETTLLPTTETPTIQTAMYVIENTNTFKLIVNDQAGKGAVIVLRNREGQIVYSSRFINKQTYIGTFDLSQLPEGMYSVEVFASSKLGYGKKKYSNTFEIQSQTNRSITLNTKVDKGIMKDRSLQVYK